MSRRPRWQVPVCAALSATALALSICVMIALQAGGEARLGALVLVRIAGGYDRRANALIDGPTPSTADLRRSENLSRKAIAEFPYDLQAWLRLASLDVREHGVLTAQGVADLRRSYDLVAVDPQMGLWRVRFALENGYAVPPDVMEQVHAEVKALWLQADLQQALIRMPGQMHSRKAMLTLALWLIALETSVAH